MLFGSAFSSAEELTPEPEAHPSARIGVSGGYGDFGALGGVEARVMLHDLMDTGHNKNHFGIGELLNLRLSWQSQPIRIRLDEFTLLRMGSFLPRDREGEKEWSYFLSAGLAQVRDPSCTRCVSGNIEAGWGASVGIGEDSPLLLFGLLSADFSMAPGFSDFVRAGAGPHAGARLFLTKTVIMMTEGYYRYRLGTTYHHGHHARGEFRWNVSQTFSLWVRGEKFPDGLEGRAGFFYYF